MAEFYITKSAVAPSATGTEASHKIYDAVSENLPPIDTLRYLGSYASKEAAFSKARGYYDNVSYSDCLTKAS